MLSRLIASTTRHLRLLYLPRSPHSLPSTPLSPQTPKLLVPTTHFISRHFSSNNDGNDNRNGQGEEEPSSDLWKMAPEDDDFSDVFGNRDVGLKGIAEDSAQQAQSWSAGSGDGGVGDWQSTSGDVEAWSINEDEKEEDVFGDIDGGTPKGGSEVSLVGEEEEPEIDEAQLQKEREELQKEEEALLAVLKGPNRSGPNRAFGDLVAASGITDDMLDSLIALKDFKDIAGLPPLTVIEDQRYENSLKKSSRYEMELQKQEEAAKSRVRQVDEKGRAYGTGRRKCSIARVWIQPGEGKFMVNDKEFDVYFPMLDHRAALLRPFAETKTLGLWDIRCTVKGGGVSGQVGAIQLGISRALQNWEPGLRPPLRDAGFLTRDPRVVERKKPGKAKARKSFQWVKR